MPVFFKKTWWAGESRDNPVPTEDLGPEWAATPSYRPGWIVKYRTATGAVHKGKIRYAFRESPERLIFYRVIRVKNDACEIAFDSSIIQRITDEE